MNFLFPHYFDCWPEALLFSLTDGWWNLNGEQFRSSVFCTNATEDKRLRCRVDEWKAFRRTGFRSKAVESKAICLFLLPIVYKSPNFFIHFWWVSFWTTFDCHHFQRESWLFFLRILIAIFQSFFRKWKSLLLNEFHPSDQRSHLLVAFAPWSTETWSVFLFIFWSSLFVFGFDQRTFLLSFFILHSMRVCVC